MVYNFLMGDKKKKADFGSLLAANTWISMKGNSIHVLGFENVLDDWGYPASARLKRPRVVVIYLETSDGN